MYRGARRCGACVVAVVVLAGWLAVASSALASAWSVQPSLSPPRIKNGSLGAVSCVSPSDCMAVGSYVNRADISAPLAEGWNGVSWSIHPAPNPSGSTYGVLLSVSCAAPMACTAVGYYQSQDGQQPLAEQWNGTNWSIQPTLSPGTGTLSTVSCTSPSACTAVGDYFHGGRSTLVERWDGVAWSIQPTPNPAAESWGSLTGVSCASATACTAVGTAGEFGPSAPLVEQWDGSAWSVQPTPTVVGIADLVSVSCSSPTACAAVGQDNNNSPSTPLVERWDGTSWSIQQTQTVAGANDVRLFDVSCASATACTAAGFYGTGVGLHGTLVEHWDGTTWSIQPTPNPANGYLRGVSCASPVACTAVGDDNDSAGVQVTLAEGLSSTGWSIEATPNPAGATRSGLAGVSCASITACIAAGSGNNVALVQRWNHGKWSMLPAPSLTGGAVSCVSPTACMFVGGHQAERWNGRRWSVQQIPHLAGSLDAVSCTSKTACTAVATFLCTDCLVIPHELPLAARWNGTTWSTEQMPTAFRLRGVSCTSPRSCTAVGEGSIERWNGKRWSISRPPGPAGVTEIRLNGVSCLSPTACVAVGTTNSPLVERWNRGKWSIERTPHPRGAVGVSLTGISCTALNACTAVGSYTTVHGRERSLVERWRGVSWSIQPSPTPVAATSSALASVSCASPTVCTAVGWYGDATGDELTLIARWNGKR